MTFFLKSIQDSDEFSIKAFIGNINSNLISYGFTSIIEEEKDELVIKLKSLLNVLDKVLQMFMNNNKIYDEQLNKISRIQSDRTNAIANQNRLKSNFETLDKKYHLLEETNRQLILKNKNILSKIKKVKDENNASQSRILFKENVFKRDKKKNEIEVDYLKERIRILMSPKSVKNLNGVRHTKSIIQISSFVGGNRDHTRARWSTTGKSKDEMISSIADNENIFYLNLIESLENKCNAHMSENCKFKEDYENLLKSLSHLIKRIKSNNELNEEKVQKMQIVAKNNIHLPSSFKKKSCFESLIEDVNNVRACMTYEKESEIIVEFEEDKEDDQEMYDKLQHHYPINSKKRELKELCETTEEMAVSGENEKQWRFEAVGVIKEQENIIENLREQGKDENINKEMSIKRQVFKEQYEEFLQDRNLLNKEKIELNQEKLKFVSDKMAYFNDNFNTTPLSMSNIEDLGGSTPDTGQVLKFLKIDSTIKLDPKKSEQCKEGA
ncbi:hypothetical protein A3Q56_00311 [Intoshia linei]|uniref:Uncharacterized protein n=1 Tax=Intoshia linei TaxID=1819745 RepID=A0A177BEA5_9BILA|nr:hypothetical protein A3Q56_00311 [Intoshia linei]